MIRNKINRLDISISYKNKAINAIKELVLLAYDKSYIDEISKEKSVNSLTYFKYPKKEKINYKLRNEILSTIDGSDLDYSSNNIDEVLESIV